MKLNEMFLAEVDREGTLTARVLENVPIGRNEWQPHPKSMPLGRLASLVALMPEWLTMMIDRDEFDLNPPEPKPADRSSFGRTFNTPAELVAALQNGIEAAKKKLAATTDDHLLKNWQLKFGGKTVSERPRYVFLRETINHLAHHRGQLTVYLRLNDAKVPAVYGPSADEQRFD
ncbi:MAG TPA: DinB family protein [Vicinamibacterales bacterium]|jgi:uncharacterized damage-inducible protein DinB|nr:DinB family protein [Vicinamibacterales bacterium]